MEHEEDINIQCKVSSVSVQSAIPTGEDVLLGRVLNHRYKVFLRIASSNVNLQGEIDKAIKKRQKLKDALHTLTLKMGGVNYSKVPSDIQVKDR